MKKDILIFCSWLDLDSNVGVFFREQAAIIADEYRPILIVFKAVELTKKSFNFYTKTEIIEKTSAEGLTVYEVYYPFKTKLGNKSNGYFQDFTLQKLQKFLIFNKIDPTFIHAHSIFDAAIWAYKYSLKYNIPYIITEHQQLSFLNVPAHKSQLAIRSLNNATLNLTVSNDKIRQFAANGLFFDFKNIGSRL